MITLLASVLAIGVARAEAPIGVQEIAGQIGYKSHQMKTCAYWADQAAAAAHARDKGVTQRVAEDAVPLGTRPTDYDAVSLPARNGSLAECVKLRQGGRKDG